MLAQRFLHGINTIFCYSIGYILLVFGVMTSIQDNESLILVFVLTHEDDKFVKVVNCSLCDKVEITHFFQLKINMFILHSVFKHVQRDLGAQLYIRY